MEFAAEQGKSAKDKHPLLIYCPTEDLNFCFNGSALITIATCKIVWTARTQRESEIMEFEALIPSCL
jgi:hypothetical protein